MYSPLLLISILVIIVIIGSVFLRSPKKEKITVTYISEKPSLQSPEYRCSTKCFDCVKQRSHQHWNPSHGQPHVFGIN